MILCLRLAEGSGKPSLFPSMPSPTTFLGAQRHVLVDGQLLRYVPDQASAVPRLGTAVQQHPALGRRGEAEDDAEQGGLAGAVRADQAGELAGRYRERDAAEDLAAAESDAYVLQAQEVVVCHRCSVETLAVTALSRALTSAVIQVW